MQRFCYRGQYHDSAVIDFIQTRKDHIARLLRDGKIYTVTVFGFDNQNLFVYFECVDEILTPTDILPGIEVYMNEWPGNAEPRWFVPMTDVYHSIQPNEEEVHLWHRTEHAVPHGMMSLMKMELLSSYTFWHVQMQEEKPAHCGKHLSIWMSEHIGLLYEEKPDAGVPNPHKGMLDTHNTPEDWSGLMRPHFNDFPDGKMYHDADILLTMSEGDLV